MVSPRSLRPWPRLAVLVIAASVALPFAACHKGPEGGKPLRRAKQRVFVIGFDGMDPTLARKYMDEGKLPNLKALAERYEASLSRSRGLRLVDIGRDELRTAAQLRAVHSSLRTPDALQMAAALCAGCRSFVTNDRDLPAVPGLRIFKLQDYL